MRFEDLSRDDLKALQERLDRLEAERLRIRLRERRAVKHTPR